MSDTIIAKDSDSWKNNLYGLPCGLYFYYANEELPDWNDITTEVIGNCGAIQSVQFVPFLSPTDLTLEKVPYDIERFGTEETGKDAWRTKLDTGTPDVYRINNVDNDTRELGTVDVYPNYSSYKSVGGEVSWANEGKLYQYPYSYLLISDGLNPPLEVKPHLSTSSAPKVMVKSTVSDRCSYGIYLVGYNGDNEGIMEALVSTDAHELPCSSNAYNNWIATNKNQVSQAIKNQQANTMLSNQGIRQQMGINMAQAGLGMVSSGLGTVGSLLEGDIGGALGGALGGVSGLLSAYGSNLNAKNQIALNNQGVQNAIQSAIATGNDMKNVPNTIISMGSDVYYGYNNFKGNVKALRYAPNIEYLKKLGDYFAMYGYKQNKVLPLNVRSRYYYNYVKTIGVNITASNIPRKHLEKIKSIFNNGVTLWHVDRDGVEVMNWFKADNYEV